MINGDSTLWTDGSVKHDLLITDGTVTVTGTHYSVAGATVTITNDILEADAFSLRQAICTENQLTFGSCGAAAVEFTVHENIPGLKGKKIKVYMIPNEDASKMLKLGEFKIYEDTLSADRTKRKVVAYDALYEIMNADVADWYNTTLPTASSSMTLAQFRAAFLSHFNITAEQTTLINDGITIKKTISPESLSGGDVIKKICEINGVFGIISNEGNFRFFELSANLDAGLFPSDTLYPRDDLYPQDINHSVSVIQKAQYVDVKFEDYMCESITALTVRTDDKDAGVTVGSGNNHYYITGNFLVYGYNATNLRTVATNILSKITNRYYKPCTINAVGNPLHEPGDGLRIKTRYRGIVTYILERKLSGIQTLKDTYEAKGGEMTSQNLNSTASKFEQLSGKTASLKVDVEGIEGRVEDIETGEASIIQQLDDEISLKVSKRNLVSDLDEEIGSGITIRPDSISINSSGAFTVQSTNFNLDSNGHATLTGAELDNVQLTDDQIVVDSSGNLSLFGGGIKVTGDYLHLSGYNSSGSASFHNIALNSRTVHINANGGETEIWQCEAIHGPSGIGTLIDFDGSTDANGLVLRGTNGSKIVIDSANRTRDIVLDGTVNVGNGQSNTVTIKGHDVTWQSLTINGQTYNFLVEDV